MQGLYDRAFANIVERSTTDFKRCNEMLSVYPPLLFGELSNQVTNSALREESVGQSTPTPNTHLSTPKSKGDSTSSISNLTRPDESRTPTTIITFADTAPSTPADMTPQPRYSHQEVHQHSNATQTQKKGHPCPHCGKVFYRKSNLNKHDRCVHQKLKPFTCEICFAKFGQKSSLAKHHLVIHLKKRKFECNECKASFGQVGDLRVHQRTVHDKHRVNDCDKCCLSLATNTHVKKHLRMSHENHRPHPCDSCGRNYGERNDLQIAPRTPMKVTAVDPSRYVAC